MSAPTIESASASRRAAGRAARSISANRGGGLASGDSGAATRWSGRPSATGKVVRQAAWRRAISASPAANAGTTSGPRMRVAAVMFKPAWLG